MKHRNINTKMTCPQLTELSDDKEIKSSIFIENIYNIQESPYCSCENLNINNKH